MDAGPESDHEALRRLRRKRRRLLILGAVLGIGLTFAGVFRRFLFHGNVDVVVEGKLYRSAQPFGRVDDLARNYGLRSILNLRGGSDKDAWYVDEVDASERLGIDLYDYPMSAVKRPRRRDLLTILDVLDRCAYPLLIHCKSGSDRTGLAVGLYLMAKEGVPPEEAEEAFSTMHGHVALFGPERLHEPFDEYAAWLAANGLSHNATRLRDWIVNQYRSDDPPPSDEPSIRPGPRGRAEIAVKPASEGDGPR